MTIPLAPDFLKALTTIVTGRQIVYSVAFREAEAHRIRFHAAAIYLPTQKPAECLGALVTTSLQDGAFGVAIYASPPAKEAIERIPIDGPPKEGMLGYFSAEGDDPE